MLKVIITGPESSGKTSLCIQLSKYFKKPFSKEYAREYLTNLKREYQYSDLLKIAKKQLTLEKDVQILDTDLITIKIWSLFKYQKCNTWILEKIKKQKEENRFYLLCKPDIPWEPDSQRENPTNREVIFKIYKKEMLRYNHRFMIIEGKNRLDDAIKKIQEINW